MEESSGRRRDRKLLSSYLEMQELILRSEEGSLQTNVLFSELQWKSLESNQ